MTVSADARADAVKDGGFVHLHTHTEYSMLDGAAKLDDLFAEAQRLGMDSLAITDHGYLFDLLIAALHRFAHFQLGQKYLRLC